MLKIFKRIIFYAIWCVVCCHCIEQLCDVERWLSDNGTPVNRLDVSSYAKTRLLQSLQSSDRLIKCSVLRAIHKEADLDRPFKQSRYKISNRELKNRQNDRERDDDVKDDRDSSPRSSSIDDKLLDAIDGASGGRRSPERWEEDGRIPNSDFGRAASVEESNVSANPSNINHQTEAQQEQQSQQREQQQEQNKETQSDSLSTPKNATILSKDQNLTTTQDASPPVDGFQNANQSQEAVQELKLDLNANLTDESIAWRNRTENSTKIITDPRLMLQKCFTTRTKIFERSQSSMFCRIFHKNFTIHTNRSEKKLKGSMGPNITTLCGSCTHHHVNNSFTHFCEVFFPVSKVTQLENSYSNFKSHGTQTRNLLHKHTNSSATNMTESNTFVTNFKRLILSCRQCLLANVSHKICLLACTPSCAQSETSHTARAEHSMKQIADKLQFIDDKESYLNSGATAAAAAEAAATEAALKAGGEMQENELPTRARQDTQGRQVNNRTNQTLQAISEPSRQDAPVKNESAKTQGPVVNGADTAAKQLEILSHSVFIEKLFDNLLSRRSARDSTELRANFSRSINLVDARLDHVTNMTIANSDQNVELRTNLTELEARLSLALVQMARLNRRLQNQIQTLETRVLGRVAACEKQLNQTRLRFEALGKRQNSQLVKLEKRIRQISNRQNKTQGCDCKQTALPAMPPMHQLPQYSALHHRQQHLHQHQYFPNTVDAILPNLDGKFKIHDCSDIYAQERAKHPNQPGDIGDGVFSANLGRIATAQVRCDMRHEGWTYILSRSNGQTDFFRNWTSYQSGFGEPSGEHFIGLDALAELTSQRHYRLWVELEDWEGTLKHVNYERFVVLGSQYNYQLHVDRFHGDASVGDSLSSHSNASFSTYDLDNDLVDKKFGGNCAKRFRGGFWYFSCYRANPTGHYYKGGKIPDKRCDGIVWKTWKGPHYSLKSIHMKIRPL